MPRPLRIGVLGCAEIARRRLLPAIAACPETELTAVASRDAARAERTAAEFGCRAVHGYPELLADPAVEAVYVPLPAALHAEWAEAALRADRHVLAEKPLTTDRDRTAALFALARERGLALMENVMFVHHPQHAAVRKLVADGVIGEIRTLHAEFCVPRRPDGDIRYRAELGGGALWDTGVYPVRAALHLLGGELETVGATRRQDPAVGVDTAGTALLAHPGGAVAQLSFGLDHGYRSRYELTGSEGRITVDRAFTPPADAPPAIRVERGMTAETPELPAHDQVTATVAAFAAAARAGRPAGEEESLRQAELLAALAADAVPVPPPAPGG